MIQRWSWLGFVVLLAWVEPVCWAKPPEEEALTAADRLLAEATAASLTAAVDAFGEAANLLRGAGDISGEARALNGQGAAHFQLGHIAEARQSFARALTLASAAGEREQMATALNGAGMAEVFQGEIELGREKLDKSLDLRRALGDPGKLANTLGNVAVVLDYVGDTEEAMALYEEALPLAEAAGDPARLAPILANLGLAYRRAGELQRALEFTRRTVQMVEDDVGRLSIALNSLGELYRDLGEGDEARRLFERALESSRAAGNPLIEALALRRLGRLEEISAPERALTLYRQALALCRRAGAASDEAATLQRIGRLHLVGGDLTQARDVLEEALALSRKSGSWRVDAEVFHSLGEMHLTVGDAATSAESFAAAGELYRRAGDPRREAETLFGLARAARLTGDLELASERVARALDLLDSVRARIGSKRLRASAAASSRPFFELAVDLLMERHGERPSAGLLEAAFELSERARARNLQEILAVRWSDRHRGVDRELGDQERALRRRINLQEYRRLQLLDGGAAGELRATEEKLADLLHEYRELEGKIRVASPRDASLSQPPSLGAMEIRRQVLDEETLLLEYALGDRRSFLWVVGVRGMGAFELPGRGEIEAAVRRLVALMAGSHRPTARGTSEILAAEVGEMLLGPAAGSLHARRLLIVADGVLHYLPFGALTLPASMEFEASAIGQPLISRFEIVNLPSASVLALLRRELANRPPAYRELAILADPVFRPGDPRVRTGDRHGAISAPAVTSRAGILAGDLERSARSLGLEGFARLPFTRREAETLAALSPGARLALDFDASRETMLSPELGAYRMIHIATHGLLNDRHPELTGLALSLVDEAGSPRDGFVRLYDIYDLRLLADLVVLSACSTGLGRQAGGEGLVGLTQGLFHAGAARVVVSLWDVADAATAELMERFYRAILEDGLRPAAALRQAQLSMRRESLWKAPYHWAGFALHGEWR